MNRVKEFFSFYKFSTLRKRIEEMGFSIKPKNVFLYIFILSSVSIVVSLILRLNIMFSGVIILAFVLLTPLLMIYKFKFDYERNRFVDIIDYMQRLIYSYQKSGKLYSALLDTEEVVSPAVKRQVRKVIDFIDGGVSKGNLYKEALSIIEDKYKCSRLSILHQYLIDSETNGGDGTDTLSVLLEDIREYSVRTLEHRAERASIKRRVFISIALGVVTLIAALYMIPAEYTNKMISSTLFQVGSTVVILLYVLLYIYVLKSLAIPYLDSELDDISLYKRAVKRTAKFNKSKQIKKSVIVGVVGIGCSVLCYILGYPVFIIAIVLLFALVAYQPFFTYKTDIKRLTKEINKAFPIWVRNLTLLLQTNNVAVSIQKSLSTCPPVLKDHVIKLLEDIDKNPNSSEPFDNFCKEYNQPDIKSTTSFLYYLSNFGSDEMIDQLDYIVKQNTYLTISEEKVRNSDSLAMMNIYILAPMVISMMKLMLDMYCLYEVFSGVMLNSGF